MSLKTFYQIAVSLQRPGTVEYGVDNIQTSGYLLVYEQDGAVKVRGSFEQQALLTMIAPLLKDALLAKMPFGG